MMSSRLIFQLLLVIVVGAATIPSLVESANIIAVNFDTSPLGFYTPEQAATDFGYPIASTNGLKEKRASIAADPAAAGNRFLRVTYPTKMIGSKDSGAQIKVVFDSKGNTYTELFTKFKVRFGGETGPFEFVKGGKIPGLCGGTCPTGGDSPADGFSARMMWRAGGDAVQYMYFLGQKGTYGEDWPWNYGAAATRKFLPGRWYTVESRVKLNSIGASNGTVQSWFDGVLALNAGAVNLRSSAKIGINTFYFSTFFGGSLDSFKPPGTYVCDFDDIVVSTERVASGAPVATAATTSSSVAAGTTTTTTTASVATTTTTTTTSEAPSPVPQSGLDCWASVIVTKVKNYYARFTIAAPEGSRIRRVDLAVNTSSNPWLPMSLSYGDWVVTTKKMTSNRTLRVTLTDRVELYAISNKPRPGKGDELDCFSITDLSVANVALPPPAPMAPAEMPFSSEGYLRVQLNGDGFASLVTTQASRAALSSAIVQDLITLAQVNTETTSIDVPVMVSQPGSLTVDIRVTSVPGSVSAGVVDLTQFRSAINDAVADDAELLADAAGSSTHRSTAPVTTTAFPSVATLYTAVAPSSPITLSAAVVSESKATADVTWAAVNPAVVPASPPPPPSNIGASSSPAAAASSCNLGCFIAVASVCGVAVAVGGFAAAFLIRRRSQPSGPF